MPRSLDDIINFSPSASLYCSCNRVIYELDSMYCDRCGDVMCFDCMVECVHCGKAHCSNCADNNLECISCSLEKRNERKTEKAFIVIEGKQIPVKNKEFIIAQTSISNSIILKLDGKDYEYSYRSICEREDEKVFDYFLYFREVWQNEEIVYEDEDQWYEWYRKINESL